ncbi:hypothetical protein G6F60_013839 [Rhizopus arrhizus]|nr:hypothetical protein G6F60_013839 [Rhizopus arrhizus]
MKEDAIAAAKQAQEKLKAPSVKPGKYDLVLDPSHTWLTIHESIGHPLELDRVLGYEANYAGTSFATLDKREQHFQYGSEHVNIFADKTQPGGLGAGAYGAAGVKCKRWDLFSNGKPSPTAAAMPTRGPASSSSAWPTCRWHRASSR